MKRVSWNDYLSINHPWTKRLTGLEPFSKVRNLSQIYREYNQEKYGSLLSFDFDNADLYRLQEFKLDRIDPSELICISLKDDIFEVKLSLALSIQ